jgi:hypothetical protein
MIDTLLVEKRHLLDQYKYWNSHIAESNSGNMVKATRLAKIERRLKEIRNTNSTYMLDESSLSRIYRHISGESASDSWGTLSAHRYEASEKENRESTEELKADLKRMGLGYVPLEGGWRECTDRDVPYNKCPEDKLRDSVERSFFVPGITRDQVEELRDKYKQNAVIYGDKKSGDSAYLINNDGSVDNLGRFSRETASQVLAQGYSKMRNGQRYVFRDVPADDPRKIERGTSFKAMASGESSAKRATNAEAIRGMYNDTIVNPATQNTIKVKTALSYGSAHPAYSAAMQYIRKKLDER